MWPFQQAASFLASLANARRGNRSLWILCIAGSGFLGAATFFSEPFGVPNENLDPSWNWALHEAFSRGLRFGHDIVFTYGPFGFLAGRMYHPQTFLLFVALKLGLSLLIIWSLFEITRTRGQWFLVVPPFFLLCSLIAFRRLHVGVYAILPLYRPDSLTQFNLRNRCRHRFCAHIADKVHVLGKLCAFGGCSSTDCEIQDHPLVRQFICLRCAEPLDGGWAEHR